MNKLKYYFKRLRFLIYILGFVLAFVGSVQVYWGRYENIFKQVFMIFYSVIKLFLFQPLESFTNPSNPLLYDLAIWLAPLGTVIGLFSVFDKLFKAISLRIAHFNAKHLVVMGNNEHALQFMNNAKKTHRILCIIDSRVSQLVIDQLHYDGIMVMQLNYDDGDSFYNRKQFEYHKVNQAIGIVSFEPEPQNFGYLKVLSQLHKGSEVLKVFVSHRDVQLKEVIQLQMDSLSNLDIHYFNLLNLMSFDLMQNHDFDLVDHTKTIDMTSKESMTQSIGKVHLLLFGFGELGQMMLRVASNQATINPYMNMEVTLVDKSLSSKFEKFDGQINHLEKVVDFNLINLDMNTRATTQKLAEINQKSPFTSIIFTLKNTQESLLNLERLTRILPDVDIAIYSENMTEVKPLADAIVLKHPKVTFFGEMSEILQVDKIMNDQNISRAKKFNAYYNEVLSQWMNWGSVTDSVEDQWLKISNIKKESSLYQTLHRNVKLKLLNRMSDNPKQLLQSFRQELDGQTVDEQTTTIENNHVMNFLSALEHKRWINFYYFQDFDYADTTNEKFKEHNCLIDDWDYFYQVRRDKVIYDFLSWLSLDDQKTG